MASTNIKDVVKTGASITFPEIVPILNALPSGIFVIKGKTKEITNDQAKSILLPILETYKNNLDKYLNKDQGYNLVIGFPNDPKGGQWFCGLNLHKNDKYLKRIFSIWYGVNENQVRYKIGDFVNTKNVKSETSIEPIELNNLYEILKVSDAVKPIVSIEETEKVKKDINFNISKSLGFLNINNLLIIGVVGLILYLFFRK